MDYARFLSSLPSLYEDWAQPSARPKSIQFRDVLQSVNGMTTPSVLQLLNQTVACLEDGEVYCEVGCYQGATLIGALLGHTQVKAYAADNFSEFDTTGTNLTILRGNLTSFAVADQVEFSDGDFEDLLSQQAFIREVNGSVGAYLYDAAHDYRSQLMGLLLIRPLLAERALLVVDDANWDAVAQATDDFVRVEPACRLELRLTADSGHASFWNGLDVLSWDRSRLSAEQGQEVTGTRRAGLLRAMKRFAGEYEQTKADQP
jgi:protein O-GlcNAc transferase